MAYKDGIVNSEKFSNTNPKILWILKEVNHDGDIEDWDMTSILQNLKTDYGIELGFEKTFAQIVHLSYGIINKKTWNEVPYHYNDPSIIDILNHIAYINVKKTSGGSTIHFSSLEKAYKENKEQLFSHINEINPDIIIYGGTYYLFETDNKEMLINKTIKHISAYHPSQRIITHELYYNQIYNQIYQ
ncbi:hypothetical protein [Flavobacterium columnare]|uniref:Uncharacterized protein n=1 Tax=Flavobacterium columnare TaxID=996 RepID=A0AA94F146_9FLAO|nr:hypothetical protein [Flavobacterium columnare]MCH4828636.1 hypothetical protein [Flavobacterium columnare]MCH4831889.1 hypothetical protein [Flavobacterium columnare]